MLRPWLACLLLMLALLPLQALADAVRIGLSAPFSGDSVAHGLSLRSGARLAVTQLNHAGGVLGRPLQLVELDDRGSMEQGAQVAQALIETHRVVATVGMVNTGVALASQRHYQMARIPVITAAATGSLLTRQFHPPEHPDNFVFRVAASDALQARAMVSEAVQRRGLTRLAIFHDATNSGQLGREDLISELAHHGLGPVLVERVGTRPADTTAPLLRAREAGAQALLVYGAGPELMHLVAQFRQMHWTVPVIGNSALGMPGFIGAAGPLAEDLLSPHTFIADPALAQARDFMQALEAHDAGQPVAVPAAAAQGYDAVLLLTAAIRQAGSTDGDAIREALENLTEPVRGVIMRYERPFNKDTHETLRDSADLLMGVVRDGQLLIAHPEERQRAATR
ncbi:MAG: ABC transporter substrate-binding protein [Rhodocyclaceae bacterium]|nr:ABC transporter substrate-binding protein [Rhodocyclaceae bacterium]